MNLDRQVIPIVESIIVANSNKVEINIFARGVESDVKKKY